MSDKVTDKGQFQDLGEALGNPDSEDKERIRGIILRYEAKHPGEIKFHRDAARARLGVGVGKNEFAEMGAMMGEKNSARRYLMELPPELHEKIEAYLPTIFRSKKHFAWFCKNFKELLIAERY